MDISERGELTNLVKTYLAKERELSREIAHEGCIPDEITERSYCSTLKYITEISDERYQVVEAFLDWATEVGIEANELRFDRGIGLNEDPEVHVSTGEDGDATSIDRTEVLKDRDVIQFFSELYRRSESIPICKHLSLSDNKETLSANAGLLVEENRSNRIYREQMGLSTEPENEPRYQRDEVIAFACSDCAEDENRTKCDCLSFDGVVYDDNSCRWRRGLLKKIAEDQGQEIRDLGKEQGYRSEFTFFLPKLDTLVTKRRLDRSEFLDQLDPSVIVVYGQKEKLLEMLEYDADVLVISKEEKSFYYFDSDRVLEDSDSNLIGRIIEDLDEYAEKERGKEHTRIQNALLQIGEEEGYVVEEEYTVSGLTVDAIWFKRNGGKAKLAAEVETTGGWKKDILSMWETEPDIALLITTNHKTDKVAKDLARFSVIKYAPYSLIYANLNTQNVFAFEDGEILGKFKLGESLEGELEEEGEFDIEDI